MRRSLLVVVLLSACTSQLGPELPGELVPRPVGFPTAIPTPSPFGDGRDLDLVITSATIVNTCIAISSISGDVISFGVPFPFDAGDYALAMQMHDQVFTLSSSTSPIVGPADSKAGIWQRLTIVEQVSDQSIRVSPAPLAYVVPGAQVCDMPQFRDVTIAGGQLRPASYDFVVGVGGVLAFAVSGRLTLESGGLYASGHGYFGGDVGMTTGQPTNTVDLDQPEAGHRGHGVSTNLGGTGRGRLANAGGGGNTRRGGGGGGGNGAAGGKGGDDDTDQEAGGVGGAQAFNTADLRLTLGGGGGAGAATTGTIAAPGLGGAGGGIVFLLANEIAVVSGSIDANGAPGGDSGNGATSGAETNGGGGGGAGGTVYLRTGSITGTLVVRAVGGDGGHSYCVNLVGPGGGGGGGRIFYGGAEPAVMSVSGGLPGLVETATMSVPHDAVEGSGGKTATLD